MSEEQGKSCNVSLVELWNQSHPYPFDNWRYEIVRFSDGVDGCHQTTMEEELRKTYGDVLFEKRIAPNLDARETAEKVRLAQAPKNEGKQPITGKFDIFGIIFGRIPKHLPR